MLDLVCIGDSTLDTFLVVKDAKVIKGKTRSQDQLCLYFADKIPIEKSVQSVGGNAANVSVGTTKLGLNTAIITEIGDDINGNIVQDGLKRTGVDTKYVKRGKNIETRYSVVINYKGERTILSCYPKRKYTFPKLPKTKWIYYTSLGPGFEKIQNKLIMHLKKNKNIKLAMNPGSHQMKKGLATVRKMIPFVDILIVNKEEAQSLVGKRIEIKTLLKSLYKKGTKTVVITDSIRGSYAFDGKQMLFMKPYPIKPIAKTGAGDAYTSGFLSAIISGKSIPQAMQWGTANAGGVIQEFGAQRGLLTKMTLIKVMKKYNRVKPIGF